jgi:hypothetical protein
MTPTSDIPVTITSEAAAHVVTLGRQREFEVMLEHTRQVVSELQAIEVTLVEPYDWGDDPRVIIEATKAGPYQGDDPTQRQLGAWKVRTFSPDICRHFLMTVAYGTDPAS